jgi:chemotaxis protein methyltransferase CheR
VLDALTPITISRFHRDAQVFRALEHHVLPALAAAAAADARDRLGAWSAGCASGEEAYTLALLWHGTPAARFPTLRLDVLASDIDPAMLRRACEATYEPSSLRDLPARWRDRGFTRRGRALMRAPRAPRPRQRPPPRPAHRAAGLAAWLGTRAIFRRA